MNNSIKSGTRLWSLIGFFTSLLLIFLPPVNANQLDQVDFISYQVRLQPNLELHSVQGKVEVRFTVLDKGLTYLTLSALNKVIYSVKGEVVSRFHVEGDQLKVDLKRELIKPKQTYSITIHYLSNPVKGIKFYPDHLFTNYHTEEWLVSHSGIDDHSKIEMWLTLPKQMKVVANGYPIDSRLVGQNIEHHWKEPRDRPLYTYGFAAGYFKQKTVQYDGIEFRYFYLQSTADEVNTMFADVPDIYQFFKEKSGISLQQKHYTFVVTNGNSMQEASGFSLIGRKFSRHVLTEPRESWLITHELAHEWWGNAISAKSWSDFWLNEGLVQFLVAAFKEQQYGRDEYDREMVLFKESILRRLQKSDKLNPVSPQQQITFTDFKNNYRGIAYSKGAYIFHMLRIELGEAHFWEGLKRYSRVNWEKSVTSKQLQQVFESVAGRKLDLFFNTWVYQPQQLQLSAKIEHLNGLLRIRFKQLQKEINNFHFWLAIDDGNGIKITKVEINQREELVEMSMDQAPIAVWLDYYQYLPLVIKTENIQDYLVNNIFHTDSTLARYWGLKALVNSQYCDTKPSLIHSTFERLKLTDNIRIIEKALNWWKLRCPQSEIRD